MYRIMFTKEELEGGLKLEDLKEEIRCLSLGYDDEFELLSIMNKMEYINSIKRKIFSLDNLENREEKLQKIEQTQTELLRHIIGEIEEIKYNSSGSYDANIIDIYRAICYMKQYSILENMPRRKKRIMTLDELQMRRENMNKARLKKYELRQQRMNN